MAATGKASWTICAMVLLAEAATAMTVQVSTKSASGSVYIVDGKPDQDDYGCSVPPMGYAAAGWGPYLNLTTTIGEPDSLCSSKTVQAAGCRCCSGSGTITGHSMCPDGSRCVTYTYSECEALCAGTGVDARGAANPGDRRLCTQAELLGGAGTSTGCYYDSMYVWSTTTCAGVDPAASATGDPHLQNIHGERFDLMKPGKHVLINIPREARAESAMLRVVADARRLGRSCADLYFEELNITGLWAEAKQAGGYHYGSSSGVKESPEWLTFGQVAAKVVHGRTQDGVQYLNLYVKHLGRAGFVVGGLLGEDDYHDVAAPDASCVKKIALDLGIRTNSPDARSFAIASAS